MRHIPPSIVCFPMGSFSELCCHGDLSVLALFQVLYVPFVPPPVGLATPPITACGRFLLLHTLPPCCLSICYYMLLTQPPFFFFFFYFPMRVTGNRIPAAEFHCRSVCVHRQGVSSQLSVSLHSENTKARRPIIFTFQHSLNPAPKEAKRGVEVCK